MTRYIVRYNPRSFLHRAFAPHEPLPVPRLDTDSLDWPRNRSANRYRCCEGKMNSFILRKTHKIWNAQISRILCRAYEEGVINSLQLHYLSARFDPTQKHSVEY